MLTKMGVTGELFHTAAGVAYADLTGEGRRQTWPIRSRQFRAWLRQRQYHTTGTALASAELKSALDLLEARALFDAPERAVHVRTTACEQAIFSPGSFARAYAANRRGAIEETVDADPVA